MFAFNACTDCMLCSYPMEEKPPCRVVCGTGHRTVTKDNVRHQLCQAGSTREMGKSGDVKSRDLVVTTPFQNHAL